MSVSPAELERQFTLIERAAEHGERCPMSAPYGPVSREGTRALARSKRIRIELYALNWRVATILVGPHKGKRTMEPPHKGARPYMTIGTDTVMALRASHRRYSPSPITLPSIPNPLTPADNDD